MSAVNLPDTLSADAIIEADRRIHGRVVRTPVLRTVGSGSLAGAELFFKCENAQHTGAFKARGAMNAVRVLVEGGGVPAVVAHSSGNHGAALAWAAAGAGIEAHVVVPRTASALKRAAVERYGARLTLCEPTLQAREAAARRIAEQTGGVLVHPFDDPRVIAGQGTAALELLEEVGDLDAIITPVGGGGLISGTALIARKVRPGLRVLGAEPEGAADARLSLHLGVRTAVEQPASLADGLLATVGRLTFPIIRAHVDEISVASEAEIVAAVVALRELLGILVEPSAATAYAVLVRRGAQGSRRVGIILTGGNLDPNSPPWAELLAGRVSHAV